MHFSNSLIKTTFNSSHFNHYKQVRKPPSYKDKYIKTSLICNVFWWSNIYHSPDTIPVLVALACMSAPPISTSSLTKPGLLCLEASCNNTHTSLSCTGNYNKRLSKQEWHIKQHARKVMGKAMMICGTMVPYISCGSIIQIIYTNLMTLYASGSTTSNRESYLTWLVNTPLLLASLICQCVTYWAIFSSQSLYCI